MHVSLYLEQTYHKPYIQYEIDGAVGVLPIDIEIKPSEDSDEPNVAFTVNGKYATDPSGASLAEYHEYMGSNANYSLIKSFEISDYYDINIELQNLLPTFVESYPELLL
jgi:hypothetical protein